ncbi:Uncharacterized protein Rs2_42198 [Raphanus sativus]|nr:Uncharacterized protein Rs2_42198 [Raphanus sativus]
MAHAVRTSQTYGASSSRIPPAIPIVADIPPVSDELPTDSVSPLPVTEPVSLPSPTAETSPATDTLSDSDISSDNDFTPAVAPELSTEVPSSSTLVDIDTLTTPPDSSTQPELDTTPAALPTTTDLTLPTPADLPLTPPADLTSPAQELGRGLRTKSIPAKLQDYVLQTILPYASRSSDTPYALELC